MQSSPQSVFDVHFTVGHPSTVTQRELTPPGLTQVQPGPHEPSVHDRGQVPVAKHWSLPPPVSRHAQPGPQDLGVHRPAGQVDDRQRPFRHVPPGHSVPFSFLLGLHLPRLRFLQGGQRFLAVVSARLSKLSVPPSSVPSAARRERAAVKARVRPSKLESSKASILPEPASRVITQEFHLSRFLPARSATTSIRAGDRSSLPQMSEFSEGVGHVALGTGPVPARERHPGFKCGEGMVCDDLASYT
jgi:hypothetical protein